MGCLDFEQTSSMQRRLRACRKFAACVADINAWLSACRLRLNAAKTQLLWLGSSQLVDRVDCHDVLVLGTRVAISDTARDPGVVTGGPCHDRLSLRLQPATPAPTSSPVVSVNATKTLVQAFIRVAWTTAAHCCSASATRRATSTPAVGAERCRPPGHRRPSV